MAEGDTGPADDCTGMADAIGGLSLANVLQAGDNHVAPASGTDNDWNILTTGTGTVTDCSLFFCDDANRSVRHTRKTTATQRQQSLDSHMVRTRYVDHCGWSGQQEQLAVGSRHEAVTTHWRQQVTAVDDSAALLKRHKVCE